MNVDIINMSLGTYADNPDLKEAVNKAIQKGIIIICASGDDSTDQYLYPASYDGVISVTSVDANNVQLIFNNTNDKIIISALGERVNTGVKKDNELVYINGTSASTAIVTAEVTDLKLNNPNLSREQLLQVIMNTSTDLGETGKDDIYGYGLLNYTSAINYINNN